MPPRPDRGLPMGAIAAAMVGSLVLHVFLGWSWTIAGGAVGGWIAGRRGWLAGGLGALLAWGLAVGWSYAVDARATGEMTRIVGALLGGLPPFATVVLTLAVGTVLGAIGGVMGGMLRNIGRPGAR